MKKIILMFIVMFSFIVVKAEEQVEVKLEWVPNVYYNYDKNGLNYWGQFAYIRAGDQIAYCLDISTTVNSSIYTKSEEVQSEYLVILAGYFGYGYDGNISLKDYMATQKLIWEYLGTEVYFTTQSNGKGNIIDINNNVFDIVYRMNNHAYFPAYDSNFIFNIGSVNSLIQSNVKMHEYNIVNSTQNDISFTDTGIKFSANDVGANAFYLESKYVKNFDNTIYVSDDSQKIMIIGEINNLSREYVYEVVGGSINVNVVLNGNKKENGGSVTENVFELYDSKNKLIGKYSPNGGGNILIEDLNIGDYKLKHTTVSEGYIKEINEYEIVITNDKLNVSKNINLNMKTTGVTINKSFGNPILNTIYYDEGVIYKIYDDNDNFIKEVVTDTNGSTTFTLEYGNYKIVESPSSKIDVIHEDIIINKSDFNENLVYDIYDLVGVINVNVALNGDNKENGGSVTENEFELYNSENKLIGKYSPNEEGNIMIENLNIDSYKLMHTDVSEGYIKEISEYEIIITNDDLYITKNINLNLKTIEVTINKSFGNPVVNTIYYDEGVIYKIYDDNDNFIKEVVTDIEGKTNFALEYGNYKIVESPSSKIDVVHEDIVIDKSNFVEDVVFNIYDEIYEAKIKFIVLDKEDNSPIPNVSFKLDDNEYVTNEDGIYITESLKYGVYKFGGIILENYKEIEDFDYNLSESSEIYVIENDAFVDVILYVEKIPVEIVELPEDNNDVIVESPIIEVEKKDPLESDIKEEIKENENINEEIFVDEEITEEDDEELEKLPFLGVYTNNESNKNFNFSFCFIKLIRLYNL